MKSAANRPSASRPTRHHLLGSIALALLSLSACKTAPPAASARADALSNGRTQTDQTIYADQRGYAAQQAAIKAANATGKHPVKSYALAKAQCWLDVSVHEYSRNDRSRFPQLALTESVKITDYLAQAGTDLASPNNPANQTPLINQAAKLRDDLWAQTAAYKAGQGMACAAQQIACAEVELVHAGNEQNQQGWRHAKPYVQIAEDLTLEAKAAIAACAPAAAAAPIAAAPAPAALTTTETATLRASALFHFDRRHSSDLLPQGRAEMDALAEKIKRVYASVQTISVTGYTDRLGTDRYNDQLSSDRAQTVKSYLQSQGITQPPFQVSGRGKADPLPATATCPQGTTPTPALTQCLQPNRRVEISITGIKR